MSSVYDFSVRTLSGEEATLGRYKGKALLIVNTASQCGFTPQYAGLQRLHEQFGARGFAVLGFPCNQFGSQEPGGADEIRTFCDTNYHVTFPMHAKIDVNGANAHPLYRWLTAEARGVLGTQAIKWNFTKFLISPDGSVVKRYAPTTKPEELQQDIEKVIPA